MNEIIERLRIIDEDLRGVFIVIVIANYIIEEVQEQNCIDEQLYAIKRGWA